MPLEWQEPAELAQARRLWDEQRLAEGMLLFARLVQKHPNNAPVLANAGRAFGSAYQYSRGEMFLNRLVQLAGTETNASQAGRAYTLAGKAFRFIRRPRKALNSFQQGMERGDAEASLQTALLLERRNQLQEAQTLAEHYAAHDSTHAECKVLLGRLARREKDYEKAEAFLKQVVSSQDVLWHTLARAWYELAALYDASQRYDLAWEAMLNAKRTSVPYSAEAKRHRDQMIPVLIRVAGDTRAEDMARWAEGAASRTESARGAMLTGLPRSGTTLLEHVLDAHPDVAGCDEFDLFPRFIFPAILAGKSLEEFCAADLELLREESLAAQHEKYCQLLVEAAQAKNTCKLVLDKNPSMLTMLVPYLRMTPRAPVLVALRDPRDVLVSCLMSPFPLNDFSVDFLDVEMGVSRIVTDITCYTQLREKRPAPFLEIKYEETVADLPNVAQRAVGHLGLAWSDDILRYRERGENKDTFSPSYDSVTAPLHKKAIGRWQNYERYLAPHLRTLATTLQALGYD